MVTRAQSNREDAERPGGRVGGGVLTQLTLMVFKYVRIVDDWASAIGWSENNFFGANVSKVDLRYQNTYEILARSEV